MASKREFRETANLSFAQTDDKKASFLNGVIEVNAWVPPGGHRPKRHAIIEPGARHAVIIVEELGLQKASGAETPSVKKNADNQIADSMSAILGAAAAPRYRPITARVSHLAGGKADLPEASKTLSWPVQLPSEASWQMFGRLFENIRAHGGADRAGCPATTHSAGGFEAALGHRVVKHRSSLQSTPAFSSGREYHGLL